MNEQVRTEVNDLINRCGATMEDLANGYFTYIGSNVEIGVNKHVQLFDQKMVGKKNGRQKELTRSKKKQDSGSKAKTQQKKRGRKKKNKKTVAKKTKS